MYIWRLNKKPSLALAIKPASLVSFDSINKVEYDLDGVSISTPRTEPC